MPEPARPLSRQISFIGSLAVAVGFAVLGLSVVFVLFGFLGYGWDEPKGRAIPVLVLFFLGGIVVFQRRRPLALRMLALVLTVALAVVAWWLTPQNHVSLREAGRLRDELHAELSVPPTWDKAFIADDLKAKYDKLLKASRSMALKIDLDGWADAVGNSIQDQFQATPPDDIKGAIQTSKASDCLTIEFSGATTSKPLDGWIDRAVTARKNELNQLADADWPGFDHTATARHSLANAFLRGSYRTPAKLIAAEEEWGLKSVTTTLAANYLQMNPKLMRETCSETEKQLLSLNSLDSTPERFRSARELLFRTVLNAANNEVQSHIKSGQFALAYGIARKLAVDWFASAQLLGTKEQQELVTLRENCRRLAEKAEEAGDEPEVAPLPRTRETSPSLPIKQ